MKIKWGLFVGCVLIILISLTAYAHPGRTDANGGHYDHSTGEYHYHHGYPAHQHIGGVCPYDYDDQLTIIQITVITVNLQHRIRLLIQII